MSGARQRTQKHQGFTLVELLVVIGIIAVIAAILFPVFARARARAYQTNCASNLKQIGLAMQLYTQDNDGRIFSAQPRATDEGEIAEWCFYRSDFGSEPHADKSRGPLSIYIASKDVWTCPAAPDLVVPYGLNIELRMAEMNTGQTVQLSQVATPTETIFVAEYSSLAVTSKWSEAEPFVYPPSRRVPVISGRHFGLANLLWFDGHVSARKPIASYPALFAKGEVTVDQLQRINQGDILKSAYTGIAKQDDYYYNLSKADR